MRKQLVQYLLIAVLLSVVFLVFPMSKTVEAETIYVDDAGDTEFSTIQAAINAANESDTIEVYSGTYNENIVINKTLTINGAGAEKTSIIGISSDKNTVEINADNVDLSGFLINNNAGKDYPKPFNSLYMEGVSFCIISQNIFEDGENGLYLVGSNNNLINLNTFRDNTQKGIFISHSDSNTLNNNIIKDNGDGVYFYDSNSNEIFENDIKNNNFGLKIATKSDSNVIYKNDFNNNYASNANDTGSNSWSKNGQGNYWDDYNDYDNNSDGIGDNPYEIDKDGNVDAFPLGDFLTVDPVAHIDSISPNPATDGENIDFYGHGTSSENIVDWEWRSNKDGLLNQGSADFSSSSLSVGTHTISFRVFDGHWSEYDTENLVINSASSSENQVPVATIVSISPTETVEGESVYMHGYGTDSDGIIVGYSWRSDKDGRISADSSFTIDTLSVGTHSISFKVKDNDGDWSQADTATVVITQNTSMNENPIAMINGPYAERVNKTIIFDASASYDPDTDDIINSYEWEFGDGKTGSGKIITHAYNQTGNYSITLTVTDNKDAETSVSSYAFITNETSQIDNSNSEEDKDNSSTDLFSDVPGFEIVFWFIGIIMFFFFKRIKRKN